GAIVSGLVAAAIGGILGPLPQLRVLQEGVVAVEGGADEPRAALQELPSEQVIANEPADRPGHRHPGGAALAGGETIVGHGRGVEVRFLPHVLGAAAGAVVACARAGADGTYEH